jgi:hypothetical protein
MLCVDKMPGFYDFNAGSTCCKKEVNPEVTGNYDTLYCSALMLKCYVVNTFDICICGPDCEAHAELQAWNFNCIQKEHLIDFTNVRKVIWFIVC